MRGINVNREAPAPEAFTVNIDRILKRIADLEADIVMAQDANAVLLKRNEALQIERDQNAARIEALTAEHARLSEHRTLADEMAQRTEKQLREDLQRHQTQIKELRDTHATATSLAERTLASEKAGAAELALRFAAKLSEHDKLLAVVEQHNHAMDEVVTARDNLDELLQQELATSTELKAKLAASEETMSANRALLLERETALAEEAAVRPSSQRRSSSSALHCRKLTRRCRTRIAKSLSRRKRAATRSGVASRWKCSCAMP